MFGEPKHQKIRNPNSSLQSGLCDPGSQIGRWYSHTRNRKPCVFEGPSVGLEVILVAAEIHRDPVTFHHNLEYSLTTVRILNDER